MRRARDPDQIRASMETRDLTLREMGLLCDCDEKTIRKILAGQAVRPDLARRVARVLRSNVDVLFEVAPSSNKQDDDERQAVA
jgi:plasmid maintenance system antidote protein VapI